MRVVANLKPFFEACWASCPRGERWSKKGQGADRFRFARPNRHEERRAKAVKMMGGPTRTRARISALEAVTHEGNQY